MNRIVYIAGKLTSKSPFMVGCGESNHTDSDVLLDIDENPFVPGTTLCGVCRHYAQEVNKGDYSIDDIFGYIKENSDEGKNSRIVFNDCFLTKAAPENQGVVVSPRDGVRLNTHKTAENGGKFDYEIVEEGCVFDLRLEMDLTEYDKSDMPLETMLKLLNTIVVGFNSGEIRIGAKSTRGFGLFELQDVRYMDLDLQQPELMERYIDFDWNDPREEEYGWSELACSESSGNLYETLTIAFSLRSFLFIRNYITLMTTRGADGQEKLVDAEQLMNKNEKPVIPGPSWAGAFRHHFVKILNSAGYRDTQTLEREVFGYVDEKNQTAPVCSKIIFSESVLEDSWQLNRTRNAIDRFTGGAADRKLFTTRPTYQGKGTLTIKLRKDMDEEKSNLVKSVIDACVQDLNEGFLSVGGETATGGGLLEVVDGGNKEWS